MNREEILNSTELKRRFCKDCNIPINVYDKNIFIDRINLFDELYDSLSKFDTFCEELKSFKNESEYIEYYNSVKDSAISYITNLDSYKDFSNSEFKSKNNCVGEKNLYTSENNNTNFISIDMRKANFSCLKLRTKIFDEFNTWEDFISKFTSNKHIINSKYIRQAILGSCNPKKQVNLEKLLMSDLLDKLTVEIDFNSYNFSAYSLSKDEILIKNINCNEEKKEDDFIKEIYKTVKTSELKNCLKVENFILKKLNGIDGYVKVDNDSYKTTLKGINSELLPQVIRYLKGEQITNSDLIFHHNDRLAEFLDKIANPFIKEE